MGSPTPPRDNRHPHPDDVPGLYEADRSHVGVTSEQVLPLVEETATVHKREVTTGKIRVRTITDSVEELARANLQSNTVEVTHVPVDKVVDTAPAIRTEGDLTIVPVLEEVLVVTKQLVLKEELHIRQRVETKAVEVPVSLRKQRAIVEREAADGSTTNEEETNR